MKKVILFALALGILLAVIDLYLMSGKSFTFSSLPFFIFLILSFSSPLIVLFKYFDRFKSFLGSVLCNFLFLGILSFTLFLPCIRYLPNYRADALEALKYVFGPLIYQGGFMLLIIGIGFLKKSLSKGQ